MSKARDKPYFYATWLAPLMVGEDKCVWKVWRKGHYFYEKVPNDFNKADWQKEHTALLDRVCAEHSDALDLLKEDQTSWKIEGTTADVGGKMDVIKIGPNLIIDAKSGKEKAAHAIQIQIYQMAVELGAVKGIEKGTRMPGLIVYQNHEVPVPLLDNDFKKMFGNLIRILTKPDVPEATPSFMECKFCDLDGCPYRYKGDGAHSVPTDLF